MKIIIRVIVVLNIIILGSCKSDDDDNSQVQEDNVLSHYQINIENTETVEEENKIKLRFKLIGEDGIGVAGKLDSDFNLYERVDGESESLIDPTEAPRVIVPSPESFAYATAIIMDLSGSVINDIDEIKTASKEYIQNLFNSINSGTLEVGVYYFDGRQELQTIIDFTTEQEDIITAIESMDSSLQENDNTALYHGVIQGCDKITNEEEYLLEETLKVYSTSLVIFSDGNNTNFVDVNLNYMQNKINQTTNGTDFYCIAAGSEINSSVVNSIGRNGVFQINNYSELNNALQNILDIIIREANSNYELEICSAKIGTYVYSRLEVKNSISSGGESGYNTTNFSEEDICTLSQ